MADPLIANIRRVCLANFPSGYQLGTHLTIENPVGFTHRGQQWADRVAARRAVRYDISYDPERDRWYLGASWAITPEPPASVEELRTGPVLGVDVNAEHLACCVLDARPSCSSIMAATPMASREPLPFTIAISSDGVDVPGDLDPRLLMC